MADRKTAPTVWRADEPYSPPYALPRSNTQPTPEPVWKADERYTPAEPITKVRKRYISPTQPWNVQTVYTPSQRYYRNSRSKQTVRRKRRLV